MYLDKTNTDINRRPVDLDKYTYREILPYHFQEDYPLLIKLLEYYFDTFDGPSSPTKVLNDLYTIRDVRQVQEDLLLYIGEEFLLGDPYFEQFTDKRLSILFSNTLYRSKGSKFSIEKFFKIFFNVDAEIEYPKKDIFNIGTPQKETQNYDTSGVDNIVGLNFSYSLDGDVLVLVDGNALIEDEDYTLNLENKVVTILDSITEEYKTTNLVTLEVTPDNFSLLGVDLQEKKLINNKQYQLYSILIKSPLSASSWNDSYKKFVHPAGMYYQAQVNCFSNYDLGSGGQIQSIPEVPSILVENIATVTNKLLSYTDITGIVSDSADVVGSTGLIRIPLEPITLSDPTANYADLTIQDINRQYGSIITTYNIKPPTGDADSAGIGIPRDSDHYVDISNSLELIDQNFYDDSDGAITI